MTVFKNRRNDAKRDERTRTFKRQQFSSSPCAKLFLRICGKPIFNLNEWKNIQQSRTYVSPVADKFQQIHPVVSTIQEQTTAQPQNKVVYKYTQFCKIVVWKTRWKVWKSTRYSGESKAFHKVSAIYGKAIYFTHSFLRHVACGYAKKQRKIDWKRHFGIYNKRRVFSDKRPAEASL